MTLRLHSQGTKGITQQCYLPCQPLCFPPARFQALPFPVPQTPEAFQPWCLKFFPNVNANMLSLLPGSFSAWAAPLWGSAGTSWLISSPITHKFIRKGLLHGNLAEQTKHRRTKTYSEHSPLLWLEKKPADNPELYNTCLLALITSMSSLMSPLPVIKAVCWQQNSANAMAAVSAWSPI